MTIRLISYDVWSTLVRANCSYKSARIKLMADAVGCDAGDVGAAMGLAEDSLDALTIVTGEQYGFTERVQRVCELVGAAPLDASQLDQLYSDMGRAFLADLPNLTECCLLEVFAQLKSMGLEIAVNSNTGFVTGDLMRSMLQSVGLGGYIDYFLFSDEVGAAKPSPRVFAFLKEASRLSGRQIMHIGDNLQTDVAGAIDSGLAAAWYNPNAKSTQDALRSHAQLFDYIRLL